MFEQSDILLIIGQIPKAMNIQVPVSDASNPLRVPFGVARLQSTDPISIAPYEGRIAADPISVLVHTSGLN